MWGAEPALRWKARGIWHSATWAEYLSAARALGLALADLGVARGEVVTLLAENRPEWLYADMGAQGMGKLGCYAHWGRFRSGRALRQAGMRVARYAREGVTCRAKQARDNRAGAE